MPRTARLKSPNSMYHVMVRSITEVLLYKDNEDKDTYLKLISYAQNKYYFTLYAFCLMDNHAHFIVDPLGGNISKIMHLINTQYATYYNHKYHRIGPVFQGRFKSEIIDSDSYLINASVYIHSNPKDLPDVQHYIHTYKYSSLYDYMNNTNRFGILDTNFLTQLLQLDSSYNLNSYVKLCTDADNSSEIACTDIEFSQEEYEYRSERRIILRDFTPKKVITHIANYFHVTFEDIYNKRQRKYTQFRALCCYFMSCFCNIPQKVIALIFGNITQSAISKLVTKGVSYIHSHHSLLNSLII